MIFCFDIDGTITEKPQVFKTIMNSLVKAGHEVYPLTGTIVGWNQTGDEYRINQLKSMGIEKGTDYTDVVVCVEQTVNGVGDLKGNFCKTKNVDFMIEDTGIYADSIKKFSPNTLCLRMPNGL